ncbi:MAG: hypothetical protein ACTHKU_01220, partial [Verrucomicrobiota bacterium]
MSHPWYETSPASAHFLHLNWRAVNVACARERHKGKVRAAKNGEQRPSGAAKPLRRCVIQEAMKKPSGSSMLFREYALEKFPVVSKLRDGT